MDLLGFHSDHLHCIIKYLDPCSRVMLKVTCKKMDAVIRNDRRQISLLNAAALNGHLPLMKYLRTHPYCNYKKWNEITCEYAALSGHLHVLVYLRGEGCPWNHNTTSAAADKGHLEVLKWLVSEDCQCLSSTWLRAAENGHLHVLKYLRSIGCPWNSYVTSYAAYGGHIDVLEWLLENDMLSHEPLFFADAALTGRLEVVKWMRSHGCHWSSSAYTYAASNNHLHVLNWLKMEGCPLDSDSYREAVETAKKYEQTEVLQWLTENPPALP